MSELPDASYADTLIVGAGAAGLMAAIFAGRAMPEQRTVLLDGATRVGAKILVAGGGRCNVTNRQVTADDFMGSSRNAIRRILASFPAGQTARFFEQIGVPLHEEEHGKLFPDSNQARTVLDALLQQVQISGARLVTAQRVRSIQRTAAGGFIVESNDRQWSCRSLILATGGKSLPKTGSDGSGFCFAESLGHTIVPPVPALVPLILEGDFHTALSGISHDVEITVAVEHQKPVKFRGSLLWTHFGISGPVVLNVSGTWCRAQLNQKSARVTVNFLPEHDFTSAERWLLASSQDHPKQSLRSAIARHLPDRVTQALLQHLAINSALPLAHLSREQRRKLIHTLLDWPLPVVDSRGYNHAEVTAGGVPLEEIDPKSMASRRCPNLYLIGEILDVDGRIGGFNFQWAFSTGHLAATAIARQYHARVK